MLVDAAWKHVAVAAACDLTLQRHLLAWSWSMVELYLEPVAFNCYVRSMDYGLLGMVAYYFVLLGSLAFQEVEKVSNPPKSWKMFLRWRFRAMVGFDESLLPLYPGHLSTYLVFIPKVLVFVYIHVWYFVLFRCSDAMSKDGAFFDVNGWPFCPPLALHTS